MSKVLGKFDQKAHSDAHAVGDFGPSLAVQSQKDEADINNIVMKFGVTGQLPQGVRAPTYGDFTGVSDYREAIEAIRAAEGSFLAMPAEVRRRFGDDAGAFVDFCSNPANLEEMRKLGLAVQVPKDASEAS